MKLGEVWEDPVRGHRVGCLDPANADHVNLLLGGKRAILAIHDPPYNQIAFKKLPIEEFIKWCELWIDNAISVLDNDSSLYVWLGADQFDGFQPLPDFMIMMRTKSIRCRSLITMRNQRGYGTQKNWMAVRQELLYYIRGNPSFMPQYTNVPKKTKGYYKVVGGKLTENLERSKSKYIAAGNVWFDIQQVFYKREENVKGCYCQKPLKAIERIILASSRPGDIIIDFFTGAGTTLLQAEISNRICYAMDIDPKWAELSIRRLLRYRKTGLTGWGRKDPYEEINDSEEQIALF
ncbi:MAG: DNA-methyltransferase [Dehalococcoidia bacterium]